MSNTSVRVRFAPSPTGYLHVGGLRTALFNYLFARKHCGTLILRIEDTDRNRFVEGAAERLMESLHALGIFYDEGVFPKGAEPEGMTTHGSERYPGTICAGETGPYIQSERLPIYREYAERLVEAGKAYRCFCTSERLIELREMQTAAKRPPKYDKRCRHLSPEEVKAKMEAGEPSVIRLDVPEDRGRIVFRDLVRGEVGIEASVIDDQVLMKSDGYPTYHLASVVDDHLMNISHVIRGEEWLPSTPKHILLYEAFGWEAPAFAHLPLLLNPDKSKLSKRQGDVAVEDYLKKGYLPEALVNFVALLGWNPGQGSTQEVFSLDGLVEAFDMAQVHKSGAIFDLRKLDWLNAHYIKQLPLDELVARTRPVVETKAWFQDADDDRKTDEYLTRVLSIEQERLETLDAAGEGNPFFFVEPDVDPTLLPWKDNSVEETKASLERARDILGTVSDEDWTRERLGEILLDAAGDRRGDFLWPLRVALSGEKKSPPPQDIAWVIGRDATLERIGVVIGKL